MDEIAALLELQDGAIARRQALAAGLTPTEIARLVRRREWVKVHRGVYANHNGPLSWSQRAWAAVLVCWPAALDGRSSIRASEGPGRRHAEDGAIAVMVAHERKVRAPDGVVPRRARAFEDHVQWNLAPPRMRYDDAVVELADQAKREIDAIAVLADACGGRRTTAQRLRASLDGFQRLARREFLVSVLDDVAAGTCSVLEHAYVTKVERPHGLPCGRLQAPGTHEGRRMFRDVRYQGGSPAWVQYVELDGRLFHDSPSARPRHGAGPRRRSGTREHRAPRLRAGVRPELPHRRQDGLTAADQGLGRCTDRMPGVRLTWRTG